LDRAAIKARAEAAVAFLEHTGCAPWKDKVWPSIEDIPALLADLEEAEREVAKITENRNEWASRMMELATTEQKLERAERRIEAVEEVLEIGRPDERDFTAPAEYIRGAMDAHEWWHAKLRAALHPVAETTEKGNDDE
jgi:hypothetical protein